MKEVTLILDDGGKEEDPEKEARHPIQEEETWENVMEMMKKVFLGRRSVL